MVYDFNGDGLVDLAMLDSEGYLALFRRERRDGNLLGYKSAFTIYDQADAVRLVDWVRRDLELDPPVGLQAGNGCRRTAADTLAGLGDGIEFQATARRRH